jgi:hypothetical protein
VKATHYGHCQACGRRQLLPGGVLADHGYSIEHGWRNGVCYGAGHAPYEQSCALIESTIAAAKARAAELRAQADAQAAVPLGDLSCWLRVYHRELSNRSRGSVYLWEKGRIEGEGFEAEFVCAYKRERLNSGPVRAAVRAQVFRQVYAKALLERAAGEDAYAARQAERIAGWAPAELAARAA